MVCVLLGCEWDCGNRTGCLLPPKECVLNFDGVGFAMTYKCMRTAYDVSIIGGQFELTLIRGCNMFECNNRIVSTKREHSIL